MAVSYPFQTLFVPFHTRSFPVPFDTFLLRFLSFSNGVKRGLKRRSDGVTDRRDDALEPMDGVSEQVDSASEHMYSGTDHHHPGGTSGSMGFKGFGKGNFGIVLPVPSSMVTPSNASFPIPYARCPEASEVEQWINDHYEKLRARGRATTGRSPRIGEVVLWRGFKTGRHGGASTAVEYFRGEVHEIIEDGQETFYSVS